jgi:hypothetical protein
MYYLASKKHICFFNSINYKTDALETHVILLDWSV